jgi:DNA-binding transcriptional MerR regulator
MTDQAVLAMIPKATGQAKPTVPPKRYRIGELANHTGLSRQTLHNYTRWGLISELEWTAGGHRVYGEDAFTRLRKIIELKRTCSMDEIRVHLKNL